MAFSIGRAKDENELLILMTQFICGLPKLGVWSYSGTGTGKIRSRDIHPMHAGKQILVTCVTAAKNAGTFSVTVGGVVWPDLRVDEIYDHQGLRMYIDSGDVDFAVGDRFTATSGAGITAATRTKKAYLESYQARDKPGYQHRKKHETFTLTCTKSGTAGVGDTWVPAIFSVVGSVSGTQSLNLQEGEGKWLNAGYFELAALDDNDKSVANEQWKVGDTIVFATSEGDTKTIGNEWDVYQEKFEDVNYHKLINATDYQQTEMVFKGYGIGGRTTSDELFVGLSRRVTKNLYTNWRLTGFRAYNDQLPMANNAGYQDVRYQPNMSCWSGEIDYYMFFNGRRLIMVANSSGVYHQMYLGWYLPYEAPKFNPYPLMVGGSLYNPDHSHGYDYRGEDAACFWVAKGTSDAGGISQCMVYDKGGSPIYFTAGRKNFPRNAGNAYRMIWPYAYQGMGGLRENLDGSYTLLPIVMAATRYFRDTVYGQMDGVYAVSGYAAQSSENIIRNGGKKYMVFQDVYKVNVYSFCAMELS